MFKLIIQDDEGKTTVVPLIRDEITIGRKEGNTIRLTERNVSRKHARLVRSNGTVLIEDLDSYNGIRVNGSRIQGRVNVAETDRIQIGDYLLELKLDRGQQANDPYADQRTQPIERVDAPPSAVPNQMSSAVTVPTSSPPAPPAAPPAIPAANGNGATAREQTPAPQRRNGAVGIGSEEVPALAAGAAAPAVVPAPRPAADGPGRLVVMSANFAGREFQLEKPALVIGRTDDNDIVINHRSISRHHAKIVREHGRYAIVDQQSSNGVRVNGEEYGKVELRRGDLIDLGHVRLRFVEPGEDFVFDRDGTVVDLGASARRGKGPMIAIAALLVAGGAVALVVMMKKHDKPAATNKTNGVTGPTQKDPVVNPPTVTPDAANAGHPIVNEHGDEVDKQLQAARDAVDQEKWGDVLTASAAVLKLDPGNDEAKRLQTQAQKEQKNKAIYDEFVKAAKDKQVENAVKIFRQLPDDSVYQAQATPEYEKLRNAWVQEQVDAAQKLANAGKCDKIALVVKKVTDVFPESRAQIEAVKQSCSAVADNTHPDQIHTNPVHTDPNPVHTDPNPVHTDPTPVVDYDGTMKEAKDAYLAGQYGKSLSKAEEAYSARPGDQQAALTAVLAACKAGKAAKAKLYIEKLKGQRQNQAKQICAGAGIDL